MSLVTRRPVKRRKVAAASSVIALALALTACGSDEPDGPGSVEGPDGDPIVLADITDTTGLGAVSAVIEQFLIGERAAADHINSNGGVGGRPIRVEACDSKADPAATTACAQEAVDKGAVAKLGLSVAWGENGFPVVKRAGIPSINPPVNPQDLADAEGSFVTGGGGEYEAHAIYAAEEMGAKTAVVFADDNPSGVDQYNRVKKAVEQFGLDLEITPVYLPAGTADPTPFVAKAVSSDPDVIFTNQSGAQGVSAYTAFSQQGFSADRIINQGGAVDNDSFFSKVPANVIDGALFSYVMENYDDTDNEEVKLYRDAMKEYAQVEGKSEFYQWGFANVMTIAAIAEEVGADSFDAASLKSFLTNVEDFPMFMGQPLSRSSAPEAVPALIQPRLQIVQYSDGNLKTVRTWFDPYTG